MFDTFKHFVIDLLLMFNWHNFYLKRRSMDSIVIQFAFGNPTGGTVNWFYFI